MTRAIYVVSVSPPLDGHIADTKALRQYRAQDKDRRGEERPGSLHVFLVLSYLAYAA